jgi:carbamoyltransferase
MHADGTCRIQTVSQQRQPRFHRLIRAFFQMTGVPVILNTSYNEQEPLVLTPDDALATFLKTPIDALFLNDRLLVRQR